MSCIYINWIDNNGVQSPLVVKYSLKPSTYLKPIKEANFPFVLQHSIYEFHQHEGYNINAYVDNGETAWEIYQGTTLVPHATRIVHLCFTTGRIIFFSDCLKIINTQDGLIQNLEAAGLPENLAPLWMQAFENTLLIMHRMEETNIYHFKLIAVDLITLTATIKKEFEDFGAWNFEFNGEILMGNADHGIPCLHFRGNDFDSEELDLRESPTLKHTPLPRWTKHLAWHRPTLIFWRIIKALAAVCFLTLGAALARWQWPSIRRLL